MAWSRKRLAKSFYVFFWKNDPLREFYSKFCSEEFIAQRSTCCVQILWNLADVKSVKSCVVYLTKNFARLSSSRYCTDRAQNLHGQSQTMYSECSRLHPNRFTFGGVISERVNTVRSRSKVNPIFGWSLAMSRIINMSIIVVGATLQKFAWRWFFLLFWIRQIQ